MTAEACTQPVDSPSGQAVLVAARARLAVVPVAAVLGLLPWWLAEHAWPGLGPSLALVLVPILAGAVGWRALAPQRPVPEIHDRQLDLIICVIAVGVAVQLVVSARWSGADDIYAAAFPCAAAAAIIVAGWGSRALWQLRWAVAMLALAWLEPWTSLTDRLVPRASAVAVDLGLLLVPGTSAAWGDGGTAALRVSHSAGVTVLDPVAGPGVLLPLYAGVLVGIAGLLGVTSARRRVEFVIGGVVAGAWLAALIWLCAIWGIRAAGADLAVAWVSGRIHLLSLLGVTVLALAAAVRVYVHRNPQGGRSDLVRRLAIAVPGARLATVLVVVLGVVFFGLGLWASPSVGLPRQAWTAIGAVEQMVFG